MHKLNSVYKVAFILCHLSTPQLTLRLYRPTCLLPFGYLRATREIFFEDIPTNVLVFLHLRFALPNASQHLRWSFTPPFHPYPFGAVYFLLRYLCINGYPFTPFPLGSRLLCVVQTFLSVFPLREIPSDTLPCIFILRKFIDFFIFLQMYFYLPTKRLVVCVFVFI